MKPIKWQEVSILLSLLLLQMSSADYFSGGIITLQPTDSGVDGEIEMTFKIWWRFCSDSLLQPNEVTTSADENMTCPVGCMGDYFMAMEYDCITVNNGDEWSFAERTTLHNFSDSNEYVNIGYSSGNWIAPVEFPWVIETSMNLSRRKDTGKINSSPTADPSLIVQLQEGCNHTLIIPVMDSDGDIIRCRLAGDDDCHGNCNEPPGLVIDSESCILTYYAVHGVGYKVFVLKIEDFLPTSETPLSSVTLQYVVDVNPSSGPCPSIPEFVPPTLQSGTCVGIPFNETYIDQIIVNSGGQGLEVTGINTTSPDGLTISPIYPSLDPMIFYANISWYPGIEHQNQTHNFCFTAVNSLGFLSSKTCIQYSVGSSPPLAKMSSLSPNNGEIVDSANVQLILQFDQFVQRPSLEAYILFREYETNRILYQINSATSNEVAFDQQPNIIISANVTLPEKKIIYIELQRAVVIATSGCETGNIPITDKDEWTFITQDLTPPEIVAQQIPFRTNENASFEWNLNEPAVSVCSLDYGESTDCSNGQFSAFNLFEGEHVLFIEYTDLENNTANATHPFYVDLTAPNTTFVQVPEKVSNKDQFTIKFVCDESEDECIYYCKFHTASEISNIYSLCPDDSFPTTMLTNEIEYEFSVYAVDSVNNIGQPSLYKWTVDLIPPNIFINDTSIHCSTNPTPNNTGSAIVSDNLDSDLDIEYSDNENPCTIIRTWTVRDEAGNTAYHEQTITKDFSPHISLLPQLSISCSSASEEQIVSRDTAVILDPCERPLNVLVIDQTNDPLCPEEFSYFCPGEFSRTWSLNDNCTGQEDTAQQIIKLYDVCPLNACGRNYSSPHGICSEGNCHCNKPWYGSDCDILLYEPQIYQKGSISLLEGQNYDIQLNLTQGTEPIVWSLISAPERTTIDYSTGRIYLTMAPVGNLTFKVRAQNEVGQDDVTLKATVKPTYSAYLDPLSTEVFLRAEPMLLTGTVEHETESPIRELLNGIVPIVVNVYNPSIGLRTLNGYSNQDSQFSVIFHPPPSEYGRYEASARHPSDIQGKPEIQWKILGMRTLDRSISLHGDTIGPYHHLYSNITVLINDGPDDLHLIQAQPVPEGISSNGINFNVTFGEKSEFLTLASGSEIDISIELSTHGAISGTFPIVLQTINGTTTFITVNLDIKENLPKLLFNPTSIDGIVVHGSQKTFTFNVTNVGKVSAYNVHIVIPNSPFFTLSGFGLNDIYRNDLTLGSTETASGTLVVQIPTDQPLGTLAGRFYVQSNETTTDIPFSILVASDNRMNFTIVVEDEYTYFAEGSPLVSDATIRLKNHRRNIDITLSTRENNGSAIFLSIPEDRYEMYIQAPGHVSKRDLILVSLESSTFTTFLDRTAVTVELEVTPTEIKDQYIITLASYFEVNVPIPVVTVTPNNIDLEYFELGFLDLVEFNVTNHGLIRAEDVHMELPSGHPSLEFTSLVDIPLFLEAKSSVIIPVRIAQRERQKRSPLVAINTALYVGSLIHSYVCGEKKIRYTPIYFRGETCCFSSSGPGGIFGLSTGLGPALPRPDTALQILSFMSSISEIFCDKCVGAVLGCGKSPSFIGSDVLPFIVKGTLPSDFKDILGSGMAVNGELNKFLPNNGVNRFLTDPLSFIEAENKKFNKIKGWFKDPIHYGLCFYNIYKDCIERASNRKKRSTRDIAVIFAEGLYPLHLSALYIGHIFGDAKWLSINDFKWVTETLRPVFDDNSELGQFVSPAELSSVFNRTNPLNVTDEDIVRLITRINSTQLRWQNGDLEPKNEDDNMISYSFLEDILNEISLYDEKAIDRGYTSYADEYNFAASALANPEDLEKEAGVCAIIKIELEQEATLTREGFIAKLRIENKELGDLENILVDIYLYDSSTKEIVNEKFSIGDLKLSGSLTGVEGSGVLPSDSTGTAEWLIIPYSEAAPITPIRYEVKGRFYYMLEETDIDMPLQSTQIVVHPDPSLIVHYFWEKNVISDDPFTDEIEPAEPFSLGVMIKNEGFGTAYEMKIKSGQPEIVENEKGLLITFQIIGATLGNELMNPSLEVDFGELPPNATKTARWWMNCTLMGEFKNYSATFENINPLGDPKLSLIDDLKIHELIRNVRMPGDDDVLDFLVSDVVDPYSIPDRIYSSKDLSYQVVNEGEVLGIKFQLKGDSIIVELKVQSVQAEWTYFTFDDPQLDGLPTGTSFRLTRRATSLTRSEDMQELPSENAWISVNVLGKKRKKSINVIDIINKSSNETNYSVEFYTGQLLTGTNPTPTNKVDRADSTVTNTEVNKADSGGKSSELRCSNIWWILCLILCILNGTERKL